MMIWSQPAASASSTPYWMIGLSTSGSISLGWALVAGKKRVPNPAAGKTALRTLIFMCQVSCASLVRCTILMESECQRMMGKIGQAMKEYLDLVTEQWDQALTRLKSFVEE